MYLSLRPFDRIADLPRLPDPATARPRANPVVVPISPVELSHLAQRFPSAWRKVNVAWDFVAVTGLARGHDYWLPHRTVDGSVVWPLLLRAYPLTLIDDGSQETLPVLVDETALSWGSVVLDPQAAADRDAEVERSCQALWAFIQSRRALAPINRALEEAGAFRPWDLTFSRNEALYGIGGLHVIDDAFMGSVQHRRIVAEFGWLAAHVVSVHRISQHRINAVLRDMARLAG